MMVIRPVTAADLDAMLELAGLAGAGLTTLPKDRDLLAKRINKSIESFKAAADRPGGESYLFVMEHQGTGRVVGACGITSKVGGFQPFWGYKIESVLFESKIINVRKEVPILKLYEDHDGPCEIGSLFLHPDFRHGGNGRMLQLVRFLFIAEQPERFESTVVSEIRGVLDERGHSPFWDALGHHFFDIDFAEADRLSVVNKKFIAELMPRHPIYIPLLPPEAQAVIGKPHLDSGRAARNLESEGFAFSNMVDIFDAGPVLSCPRDQIRTVRASRKVKVAAISAPPAGAPEHMIGTAGAGMFRACKGPVEPTGPDAVAITPECAAALDVGAGDAVRLAELDPPPRLQVPKPV
ncbi:MAG: arginine N-succinyltransferase [Tepidisphaeraceae bacterium]